MSKMDEPSEEALMRAEIRFLRGLLYDVAACWQSRPLMSGDDAGHFNQRRLRDLYPRIIAAIPYDERPTDPAHGGKIA